MNTLLQRLERMSPWGSIILGIALMATVGIVDIVTGYELAFSLFYLIPISTATWSAGKTVGAAISIASAITWFAAERISGHPYSHPAIIYWNTSIRFGFFIIVTVLLSALRAAYNRERDLAQTDPLTGALNGRFFSVLLQAEIDRLRRSERPFTLVYIDVDNFKFVNDHYGHSVGDEVLQTLVQEARGQLRAADRVARLGGDEFAILLPETDCSSAQVVISRLQGALLGEMRKREWPVTFSIGALTCVHGPASIDELLRQADTLMYSAKNGGKNNAKYALFSETSIPLAQAKAESKAE